MTQAFANAGATAGVGAGRGIPAPTPRSARSSTGGQGTTTVPPRGAIVNPDVLPATRTASAGTAVAPRALGDSLHSLPPDVQTFADTNHWCTAAVPEFQDAQRFVQPTEQYGPIAQSLSSPALADLRHTKDFEDSLVNVAIIYIWPENRTRGLPYTNLQLASGLNCVFLQHESGKWTAKVAPPVEYRCKGKSAAVVAATGIAVSADDSTEAEGTIPPVTRFEQDGDKVTLLGVRCGALWCNVGAAQGQVPVSILAGRTDLPLSINGSAQARIKGWYDEQQIAIDDRTQTPPLKPGKFAAIVPVVGLGDIKVWQYAMTYQTVAWVYMPDGMPMYRNRFAFGAGWNKIEIFGDPFSVSWLARITDDKGRRRTRHVDWTQHSLGPIPGTVRWDWLDNDEWIWISCDIGCCLIRAGSDGDEGT